MKRGIAQSIVTATTNVSEVDHDLAGEVASHGLLASGVRPLARKEQHPSRVVAGRGAAPVTEWRSAAYASRAADA